MTELEKWCKDKDPLVGFLAKLFVPYIDILADSMRYVQAGTLGHLFACKLDINQWSQFYRDPAYIDQKLMEFFVGGKQAAMALNGDVEAIRDPGHGSFMSVLIKPEKEQGIDKQINNAINKLGQNNYDEKRSKSIAIAVIYVISGASLFPNISLLQGITACPF